LRIWLARHQDSLIATDEESLRVIRRLGPGECQCFNRVAVRDPVAHRRYWGLMTMIAHHVDRIEIDRIRKDPVYIPIFTKDNAHTAMKLCTGHYDTLPVGGTAYAVRVPRSTNFEDMSPDEWAAYWPRVMDVVEHKVFPEVEIPEVQTEMLKCMGWAA
jgi:hypothetical protein